MNLELGHLILILDEEWMHFLLPDGEWTQLADPHEQKVCLYPPL